VVDAMSRWQMYNSMFIDAHVADLPRRYGIVVLGDAAMPIFCACRLFVAPPA